MHVCKYDEPVRSLFNGSCGTFSRSNCQLKWVYDRHWVCAMRPAKACTLVLNRQETVKYSDHENYFRKMNRLVEFFFIDPDKRGFFEYVAFPKKDEHNLRWNS